MAQSQNANQTNESSSNRSNGSSGVPQASTVRSNGNTNGSGATASTSATGTVEGWVSSNLTSFVTDPDSGPDLPGLIPPAQTQKAPSQTQTATGQNQKAPTVAQQTVSNGAFPSLATDTTPSISRQQQLQEVQQQQQQQQSQQQLWQQQQQRGGNGVSQGAKQSWGSVKQKGPAGAWQGRGQGPAGGSGGSWAQVDDSMENARRLLSPWRFALTPFYPPWLYFCPVSIHPVRWDFPSSSYVALPLAIFVHSTSVFLASLCCQQLTHGECFEVAHAVFVYQVTKTPTCCCFVSKVRDVYVHCQPWAH